MERFPSLWSLCITPIWNSTFFLVKQWYLYAPRVLGGRENLPLLDICASNLGISSTVLLSKGGEAVCSEQLDNKITGICTMIMTGTIVAICIWMPTIFSFIRAFFFDIPKKKKERVESNKSIIILAKILQACQKKKTPKEKEIWKIFENENNCSNVKERTLDYVIKKTDSPQLLLEYK